MSAKLLWFGVGMVLTAVAMWQARQAGWVRTPAPLARRNLDADGLGSPTVRSNLAIAEGRLVTYPGAEVVIATELGGLIVALPVQALRAEAHARVEEAQADIRFFELELKRTRGLISRRAASDVEMDINQRGLDAAAARRMAAAASERRYDALLAKTRITSPIDGVVIARFVHPGETVDTATHLVTIADLKRVRVEAEVDEVDIGAIALGSDVMVLAEGFPGKTWRGKVEEIPDVVVGRHLRPEDTSRPVDTRVLLVKIALLEPTPLKLGQRVDVEIHHP
jgi:HlyD family secretion protein